MTLYELRLESYENKLKSSEPAPGGGTAAALSGMQGAALTAMVAGLTIGRAKYAQYEALCRETVSRCEEISRKLLTQMEADAQAYFAVAEAFKLPKESPEEKLARSEAIQRATLKATQVPFETMKLGLEALRRAEQLIGRSNTNAASDLGVAALSLHTCVYGAWLNVKINVSGLKDVQRGTEFSQAGEAMCQEAERLKEKIYRASCAAME